MYLGNVSRLDGQPGTLWCAGMQAGAVMPGGMINPQAMPHLPHLPQLAQPNMMAPNGMGYSQMMPQQAFGGMSHGSGSHNPPSRPPLI